MKIIILGLSGSGKSSVSPKIAHQYGLKLIEADDEVMKENGNIWPFDDEFIDKIFEITNDEVLKTDNVLYVTSWLSEKRIKEFYDKGFVIIEMHADYEELLKRKIARNGMEKWQIDRFKNTYTGYFETVLSEETIQYFTLSVDTTKITVDEAIVKMSEVVDSI